MDDGSQALTVSSGAAALVPIRPTHPILLDAAKRDSASKRLFDIIASLILIILTSPTILLIGAALLCCGGAVFFGHQRIGAGGKPFRCLKFRTMVQNGDQVLAATLERDPVARAEWESKRKLVNDPRVTWLGRVLRKTSLDELPQLINVLRGDMSLVGPRPIVREEEVMYGDNLIYYVAVRPGITGLWQISGRSNTSFEQRVAFDRCYVEQWSLGDDMLILLRTIPALLARKGAY